MPVCRLQTDPTNPLEAVESYQEGANLLSQARWIARPSPVAARTFKLHSTPSSPRRAAAWPLEIEPPAARGRRWRWRRSTTQGSRRCRARSTWRRPRLQKPKLALATACGHGQSLACGLPPPPRCLGASVGQLSSASPSYIHAGRRARAIHPSPETGQAAARLAEHNDHAGLTGTGSRRREARSQESPITTEGPGAKGPGAMGPGAERPGAEI